MLHSHATCAALQLSKQKRQWHVQRMQAKVAKSSSWRVWLGSWRSSSTGAGRNGKPGSGSLDAAVAAATAATHHHSPAAQQVSKHAKSDIPRHDILLWHKVHVQAIRRKTHTL